MIGSRPMQYEENENIWSRCEENHGVSIEIILNFPIYMYVQYMELIILKENVSRQILNDLFKLWGLNI